MGDTTPHNQFQTVQSIRTRCLNTMDGMPLNIRSNLEASSGRPFFALANQQTEAASARHLIPTRAGPLAGELSHREGKS